MRRILIILCLLAVCVAVSALSVRYVSGANDAVSASVARSLAALDEGDENALARELTSLIVYWDRTEGTLVHFVRHTGVDDVTKSVARLRPLAAGREYPALAAELESIKKQMEHITDSERISFANLL